MFVYLPKQKQNNTDMKTYQTTQASLENRIIRELNAAVLSSTFKNNEGLQLADVYQSEYSKVLKVVAHNTCAPINTTFKETILIEL